MLVERTEPENSKSVLDPVGKGDQREIPHNTDQKTCKTNVCLMFTCKVLSSYQFKMSVWFQISSIVFGFIIQRSWNKIAGKEQNYLAKYVSDTNAEQQRPTASCVGEIIFSFRATNDRDCSTIHSTEFVTELGKCQSVSNVLSADIFLIMFNIHFRKYYAYVYWSFYWKNRCVSR